MSTNERHEDHRLLQKTAVQKPWAQFWNPTGSRGAIRTLRLVPAQGRAKTVRPQAPAAEPGLPPRRIGRLIMPGSFDSTRQFALDDTGGRTRLTQPETFRGVLVPFTGTIITRTEAGFRALNHALKRRAERAARP